MSDQLDEIRRLSLRLRRIEKARAELRDAVRDARPHHTYEEIARAAGVTRQRVHQLVKGA